ncbi:MAG: hypothetical protein RR891_10810 [Clostridium sp.]
MKIKDITRKRPDVISSINSTNQFKNIKLYQLGENIIIVSITHNDKTQISASTTYGPSSFDTITKVFNALTPKDISNFIVNIHESAIYFIEKDIIIN